MTPGELSSVSIWLEDGWVKFLTARAYTMSSKLDYHNGFR